MFMHSRGDLEMNDPTTQANPYGEDLEKISPLASIYMSDDEDEDEDDQKRCEILDTAKSLICGDRQDSYGDARSMHELIGSLWSPVLGVHVTPEDVARCMILLKVARSTMSDDTTTAVDICGYAALLGEMQHNNEESDFECSV